MNKIDWLTLSDLNQLNSIDEISKNEAVIIFKHSNRCAISSMSLSRLERTWNDEMIPNTTKFFLDLINYRDLSNQIANIYDVRHESPQLLIIKNGECIYHASHMSVSFDDMARQLN